MKRPSNEFLSAEIADHLDERTLSTLAEAEAWQDWDRKQQLTLFEIPRQDADAILGWLQAVLAAGTMRFGDRWPAGISVAQAHSQLADEDRSEAALELRIINDKRQAVIKSCSALVSRDDSLEPLFEADLLAGERISTRALFASLDDRSASVDGLVRAAIEQVGKDILGP
ncbi:MAG: hypothetical protein AAGF78_05080 [Pseudomonadota bacterium]